jgi:hypothetical protein
MYRWYVLPAESLLETADRETRRWCVDASWLLSHHNIPLLDFRVLQVTYSQTAFRGTPDREVLHGFDGETSLKVN